jgi:hypothetical protein
MKRFCGSLFLVLAALYSSPHARGALVDWDTLTWAPGSLSKSFDVDPSNAGNDIAFTLSGNTGTFTNDVSTGIITPAITMSLQGGQSPVQKSLELAAKPENHVECHVNGDLFRDLCERGQRRDVYHLRSA